MLFVQVDTKDRERIFLVSGEPETGHLLLEALSTRNPITDPQGPGITVHATPAQEYLDYWNQDQCAHDPENRVETIEGVARKYSKHGFRRLEFVDAVAAIRAL